jgi:hypothetical protein
MDNSRLPKQALLYKPRGRRDVSRPRKRWTTDVGTGDSPIPWSDDDDDDEIKYCGLFANRQSSKRNVCLKSGLLQIISWIYFQQVLNEGDVHEYCSIRTWCTVINKLNSHWKCWN